MGRRPEVGRKADAGRRVAASAAAFVPRSIRVGDWRITALSDGTMRLDGGSMWGVVPKSLWKEWTPPAEDNTIELALRPFLAERGDVKALVEVGAGDRWEEKWRSIYHMERSVTLETSLRACGLAPDEITHVVASHCHFDHIGAQVVERDGELFPLFPNARHFAPRIEIEVAKHTDGVRRASYRASDVLPIERAGLLEPYDAAGTKGPAVSAGSASTSSSAKAAGTTGAAGSTGEGGTADGSVELLPGIRAHDASGHSDGVCVITINEDGPGETAIFWADVVPTSHHLQPAYIMAYDIDVVRSFESRSRWLAHAAEHGWIGLLYHDAEHAFGRIRRAGKRYAFEPILGEPR